MTISRALLVISPVVLMVTICLSLPGIENWLTTFGKSEQARLTLGRIGLAVPYVLAAASGVIILFAAQGARSIKTAGYGVAGGALSVVAIAVIREGARLAGFSGQVPAGRTLLSYVEPSTAIGSGAALVTGAFALRVAIKGNAAFASSEPKRMRGKRALHGEADWMKMPEAEKLFSEAGGMVIGETHDKGLE